MLIKCFDCQALVWYAYVDEVLLYMSKIAEFEASAGLLEASNSWGHRVSICTNIEGNYQRPCFSFVGIRKRKVMKQFLEWVKRTPAPDYEVVRLRLEAGPGNDEHKVHEWCRLFNCSDVFCNGMH